MKLRQIIYSFCIGAALSTVISSCTQQDIPNNAVGEGGECRLIFTGTKIGFTEEGTRGDTDAVWVDKSEVYLNFSAGAESISGKAIYDSSSDEWTLYYNGILPNDNQAACRAYYFEKPEEVTSTEVKIGSETISYVDLEATYSKTNDGVIVNVNLSPATGRIRFKGEIGKKFSLSGADSYSSFSLAEGKLNFNPCTKTLEVGTDGNSAYQYIFFSGESRKMVISYDNLSFATECQHPILDRGLSGIMELPTAAKHNGWNKTEMSLPTLSAVTVAEITVETARFNSRLLSDGNGKVREVGFCYSTTENPTVSDAKISCGNADGEYSKYVSDLKENTTYHVRAYALNELGVGYSEDVSFTTLEVTVPSVSAVKVLDITDKSAEIEASVTSLGNGKLTEAGFVYATSASPTLSDKKISCGKTENLKSSLSGLTPETTYHLRAYATNEKGTSYGSETTFTTTKYEVIPYTTITVETSYGSIRFDMAKVNGGTFMMGAQSASSAETNYDKDADRNENPVHKVTLDSYFIGKTEVTQWLWYVVMGSYPSLSSSVGRGDDFPVYNVTYTQCQQFIKKLNALTGKTFRLPTEAEWEFAARGGNNASGTKYSGDSVLGNVAWYSSNAMGKTHSVAEKAANELNVYDMSGNVWEWCSDWYGNYTLGDQKNPTGSATGPGRIIRGGSYEDAQSESRNTTRSHASETESFPTLGLRLVME